jgi:uncharacterized membrane protein
MNDGILNGLIAQIRNNPGRFFGGLIGFIVGLSLITLGFWRTFIMVTATIIGYVLGKWSDDEGKGISDYLDERFPGRSYFR